MRPAELILLTRDQLEEVVIDAVKVALKHHLPAQGEPAQGAPQVMNLVELCAYVGLSADAVYRKTSAGEIPHSKRGKKLYFSRAEIDKWLLANSFSPERIRDRAARYTATKGHIR